MSLFAKSVFGYDMSLETDLTENYYNTINDAMEESQLLTENYNLSREVLQEGVMGSIKNFFLKAWEGIKKFFNYIIKKIGDFINYIKSLFSKKKNEKNEETSDSKKDDGKKSINEPAPGIPVKMEVKKAEEAVVAARQEVSKAKTPEAKKAAEKKVEQAKANLEKVKKEANTKKSTYTQSHDHNFGSSTQNVSTYKSNTNKVSGISGRQVVIKNYLDLDKINVKSAIDSIKKNVFATLTMLTKISKNETDNDKNNFATFLKKNKEAVDGFINNIEQNTVESKEFNITMSNVHELLSRMDGYRNAANDALSVLKSYDNFANELIIKGTNQVAAKYANNVFKDSFITPFNKLANRISKSAFAIGQECVKFLNPNAKPVTEE